MIVNISSKPISFSATIAQPVAKPITVLIGDNNPNIAHLNRDNTFTGDNTFNGDVSFNGTVTLPSGTLIPSHQHEIGDINGLSVSLSSKADLNHSHSFSSITDKPEYYPTSWSLISGIPTFTLSWDEITNKPSSFTPSSHGHLIEDVNGLSSALSGKSDVNHTHDFSSLINIPSSFPPSAHTHSQYALQIDLDTISSSVSDLQTGKADLNHSHSFDSITGKPVNYPTTWDMVANKPTLSSSWNDLTDKPTSFPPSVHTHSWNDLTDKPSTFTPSSHTHDYATLTGIPSSFTPSAHTHPVSEVEGLASVVNQVGLNTSAITGLQLDKADKTHTHSYSSLSDIPTEFTPSAHTQAATTVITVNTTNFTGGNAQDLIADIDTKVPKLSTANTYTSLQTGRWQDSGQLFTGSSCSPTVAIKHIAWTLNSGSNTFTMPVGYQMGETITIVIKQPSSGIGTVNWTGANIFWASTTPPVLAATNANVDIIQVRATGFGLWGWHLGTTAADSIVNNTTNFVGPTIQAMMEDIDAKTSKVGHAHDYSSLIGVPTEFPPSAHTQAISTITGLRTELDTITSATKSQAGAYNSYGFADPSSVQVTWTSNLNDVTLTVSPKSPATDFKVYVGGQVYTFSSLVKTSTLPNGTTYYYVDSSGTLQASAVLPDITQVAMVFALNWNNNTGARYAVLDQWELHGCDYPVAVKKNAHLTSGAKWVTGSGFNLIANKTTGTPNASGLNTMLGITAGSFMDEDDLVTTVNSTLAGKWQQDHGAQTAGTVALATGAQIPVTYYSGFSGIVKTTNGKFPFLFSTNTPWYFNGTNEVAVPDGSRFVYWIIVTKSQTNPIRLVPHRATYTTLALAQAGASIAAFATDMTGLDVQEVICAWRVIFRYNSGWGITAVKNTAIEDFTDFRAVQQALIAGAVIPQAGAIPFTPTATILDTNVQAAIENHTHPINPLTAKTALVDADEICIGDSAASNALKKISWANIKATLAAWAANITGQWTFNTVRPTSSLAAGTGVTSTSFVTRQDVLNVANTFTQIQTGAFAPPTTSTSAATYNHSGTTRAIYWTVTGGSSYTFGQLFFNNGERIVITIRRSGGTGAANITWHNSIIWMTGSPPVLRTDDGYDMIELRNDGFIVTGRHMDKASAMIFVPTGSVASTNVQDAIAEVANESAKLSGPNTFDTRPTTSDVSVPSASSLIALKDSLNQLFFNPSIFVNLPLPTAAGVSYVYATNASYPQRYVERLLLGLNTTVKQAVGASIMLPYEQGYSGGCINFSMPFTLKVPLETIMTTANLAKSSSFRILVGKMAQTPMMWADEEPIPLLTSMIGIECQNDSVSGTRKWRLISRNGSTAYTSQFIALNYTSGSNVATGTISQAFVDLVNTELAASRKVYMLPADVTTAVSADQWVLNRGAYITAITTTQITISENAKGTSTGNMTGLGLANDLGTFAISAWVTPPAQTWDRVEVVIENKGNGTVWGWVNNWAASGSTPPSSMNRNSPHMTLTGAPVGISRCRTNSNYIVAEIAGPTDYAPTATSQNHVTILPPSLYIGTMP